MSQLVTLANCESCINGFIEQLRRRLKHWEDNSPLPLPALPGGFGASGPGQPSSIFAAMIEATIKGELITNPTRPTFSFEERSGFKPGRDFRDCCRPLDQTETEEPLVERPPSGGSYQRFFRCVRSRTPTTRECSPDLLPGSAPGRRRRAPPD